jgi:hypothetical protein
MASDLPGLRQRRDRRAFAGWDGFRPAELVARSEEAVRQLIDRLIALGPDPMREQVQARIDECVRRFNELDAGHGHRWICTIEREDISEVLWELIDLSGFEGSEEWLDERDW